jgi:hypothetical protein
MGRGYSLVTLYSLDGIIYRTKDDRVFIFNPMETYVLTLIFFNSIIKKF